MIDDTAEVVMKLIVQQRCIFDLGGDGRVPEPNPPIAPIELMKLREWWQEKGCSLPRSYEKFLNVCNGIRNFSYSFDLHGSSVLLSDEHVAYSKKILEKDIGLPLGDTTQLILIGSSPETSTRLIADLRHERLKADEAVIFDGDPGYMSLHDSFGDFLRLRLEANKLTIEEMLKTRSSGNEFE